MINTDDFIKRLEKVLDYYALTASSFADKVGVQRSSLSHLLSGRNKPSLDFILKVIEEFPEVDLYWILNGKGNFPTLSEEVTAHNNVDATFKKNTLESPESTIKKTATLFSDEHFTNNTLKEENKEPHAIVEETIVTDSAIDYIVVFYKDGTFKKYIAK